jgi:hypothetical protein
MTSPYSRPLTDPGERTIRLLHLNPQRGDTNTEVSGCLIETSVDDPLPYSALSYRWGEDKPHIPVELSSGTINVTANGYNALVALWRKGREFNLWMDAICIDQSNDREKAIQVAMMEKVYSKADNVIVWLGNSNEDADEALEWCKRISRCVAGQPLFKMSYKPNLLDRRTRRQAAIQLWEFTLSGVFRHLYIGLVRLRSRLLQQTDLDLNSVPDSVQSLFAREWFSRMWTVQEVALAHEAVVRCGSKSIYWSHLVAGIQHAEKLHPTPATVNAVHAVYCVQFFWLCLLERIQHESDERWYGWFVWTRRSINALRWVQWLWTQALKATVVFIIVRRYFSGHWRLENDDVDAWVLIVLGVSFIPILLYFDPPTELAETRRSLLRDSLVVNINRVRRRDAGDLRDKVFALYGTLRQLNVPLDAPQYAPDVPVPDVYHRFTLCFIEWHRTLDILVEASWPPLSGAPTWVPDLSRPYERWDVHEFKAAGESRPHYWFEGCRNLYTTGLQLGTVSNAWVDHINRDRRRFSTIDREYTGLSPAPLETGDVTILISGVCVPMVLRPRLDGFEVVGMAEVDGIMDGNAWRPASKLEVFKLI